MRWLWITHIYSLKNLNLTINFDTLKLYISTCTWHGKIYSQELFMIIFWYKLMLIIIKCLVAKLFHVFIVIYEDYLEKTTRGRYKKVNEKFWFSRLGRNIFYFVTEDIVLPCHEDHEHIWEPVWCCRWYIKNTPHKLYILADQDAS